MSAILDALEIRQLTGPFEVLKKFEVLEKGSFQLSDFYCIQNGRHDSTASFNINHWLTQTGVTVSTNESWYSEAVLSCQPFWILSYFSVPLAP